MGSRRIFLSKLVVFWGYSTLGLYSPKSFSSETMCIITRLKILNPNRLHYEDLVWQVLGEQHSQIYKRLIKKYLNDGSISFRGIRQVSVSEWESIVEMTTKSYMKLALELSPIYSCLKRGGVEYSVSWEYPLLVEKKLYQKRSLVI